MTEEDFKKYRALHRALRIAVGIEPDGTFDLKKIETYLENNEGRMKDFTEHRAFRRALRKIIAMDTAELEHYTS